MKTPLFYFMLILLGLCAMSQNAGQIPRDTSYTLSSALEKALRYNIEDDINISVATSGVSGSIESEKSMIYQSIGERKLLANLFYPKVSQGKRPAVLIIHGGGWRSGDPSLMTAMAERLAANGYFVMAPEYRLSLEAQYPAGVLDLYDALEWMTQNAKKYQIDTDQLVVMGCSAGAQLAALVGTTYNQKDNFYDINVKGRIAAIVVVDGVLAFKHPDSAEGEVASWWLGGTWEEKPDIWTEASALTHVDKWTPPTIFLASKYPRFLAGRQDYIAKLEKYGTASKTHFMDGAPHSFWLFNPWYEPTMSYVLSFLSDNLK
ncbi:alpha/beta hydrolase [Marinoscillum sp. MHG1-6]|uniref:alpha/beta hydrolase n=1 Tax=Marinoscillum sp. MHG1-6 TaxID=2959627 RepID=UPI002157617B|nr:alpha/beta hydrolase [Marinoscillum sp. MHG1-6]